MAMPVNTTATPARTSAKAVKPRASERAVTAAAMAAPLLKNAARVMITTGATMSAMADTGDRLTRR
jgi:DNA-binding transcriptional regulator LsrR (DeoR family)